MFFHLLEMSAKVLVPILNCCTNHEFTIKDSFLFSKGIVEQGISLYMFNLDADSVFTNTPLEGTIFICTEIICDQSNSIEGLKEEEIKSSCLSYEGFLFSFK